MKRILFLDQSGQLGGAELCLLDLAVATRARSTVVLFDDGPFRQRLDEAGVNARVISMGAAGKFQKSGGLRGAWSLAPAMVRMVMALVREAHAHDVIYANTCKALVVGAVVSRIARKPMIAHLHDILSTRHFSGFNLRLLVGAADRACLVIANSQATADAYQSASKKSPTVQVIPNGFDPMPFFGISPERRSQLRMEWGSGDAFTIGVFGRLSRWKGQHVVLDALKLVPGVHAVFVGDALFTGDDREYRSELMATASGSELAGRAHFLGFRDDIPELMQCMDAVVHASIEPEPFGRVIVEGMFAARPVIASNEGGPKELILDGTTGILITPDRADLLADAIQKIQCDPDHAAQMGGMAREFAVSQYAIDTVVRKVLSMIECAGGMVKNES